MGSFHDILLAILLRPHHFLLLQGYMLRQLPLIIPVRPILRPRHAAFTAISNVPKTFLSIPVTDGSTCNKLGFQILFLKLIFALCCVRTQD
jgi:hypothetical protein